jgi:transcriptional regulator
MAKSKTVVLQGTLDLIVLKLLRAGPANGWELTQSIQVISKGVLDVNYGSLYPALRRLETRAWVTGRWAMSDNNRRARYYELTAAGRKQLVAERESWKAFADAIGLILRTD